MKPILYQYTVCPFCHKVNAILQYKGVDYATVEVHPLNKKEIAFSTDYKKVPIYIDSHGVQVNDSTEIMRHIDAEFPENKVFSGSELEEKWLNWSSEILVRALPPVIYSGFKEATNAFDYITKIGKFSFFQKLLVKYAGAFVMTKVAKKSAKKQNITDPTNHLKMCLAAWGDALGNRDFLEGDKPCGADMAVYGIILSVYELPSFSLVKENRAVYQWFERMRCPNLLTK